MYKIWPVSQARLFKSIRLCYLKLTAPLTVFQTSAWPAPSAHPPLLWCAWSSQCWRRTRWPLGCSGVYTNAVSDVEGTRDKPGATHLIPRQHLSFWVDKLWSQHSLTSANLSKPCTCPFRHSKFFLRAKRRFPSMMKATCLGMGPAWRT